MLRELFLLSSLIIPIMVHWINYQHMTDYLKIEIAFVVELAEPKELHESQFEVADGRSFRILE